MRMRLQDLQDPANRQEVVSRRTPAGLQHRGEPRPGSRCLDFLTLHLQIGEIIKMYCRNSPRGLKAAARRAESRQRPDIEADGDKRKSIMKNAFKNTIVEVNGEELTSQSDRDPWFCVCGSGSHIKARSSLEARAPLWGWGTKTHGKVSKNLERTNVFN